MSGNVKRALRAVCLLLAITLLGTSVVYADTALTEEKRQQLEIYGNGLTDTIILMDEAEMEEYENSADSFTVSSMEAWRTSKDELGAPIMDADAGEVTVTEKSGKYTVTVPRLFEKANVNFVYIFDRTLSPTAITIDVKLPMGVTIVHALLNTIIGICTVFLVLVFLSFVIAQLGKVPALVEGKKKGAEVSPAPVRSAAPAAAPAAAATPAAVVEESDDLAIVAAITAAIEAFTGKKSGDDFVVRSIRRSRPRH
ncbi:MAG: OadG family protein [Blautia sp.]|nr:OadG family protein [Blautia sp.]